ncbi:MAG: chemotaxis response regulator protein-glutamate methylesterase [Spirochaetota bacterium]
MSAIQVLVIDDSALVRKILSEYVNSDPDLQLVYAAPDPIFALQRMEKVWPDVIVLDIEMPRMNGITFLQKIMRERPTPVVICSSLTTLEADTTLLAMQAGAVDIITKPQLQIKKFLEENRLQFVRSIKSAAHANLSALQNELAKESGQKETDVSKIDKGVLDVTQKPSSIFRTTQKVVAIGTSTGGTIALEYILKSLSYDSPGIVIVQHMPEKFTASFAQRLHSISQLTVKEAEDQDKIQPGLALVAPGNQHMQVDTSGATYFVRLSNGPRVNRHRPSVDVLFRSLAKKVGKNAVGVIMTGMGDDGALGMKDLFDSGAATIAQDEKSSVVFGMPKEAIKRGGVAKILSLEKIPSEIIKYRA